MADRGIGVWACILMILAALSAGVAIGRNVQQWDSLQAEATPPAKVLDKYGAWNGIYGCPRAPREDLRVPAPSRVEGPKTISPASAAGLDGAGS